MTGTCDPGSADLEARCCQRRLDGGLTPLGPSPQPWQRLMLLGPDVLSSHQSSPSQTKCRTSLCVNGFVVEEASFLCGAWSGHQAISQHHET